MSKVVKYIENYRLSSLIINQVISTKYLCFAVYDHKLKIVYDDNNDTVLYIVLFYNAVMGYGSYKCIILCFDMNMYDKIKLNKNHRNI